MVYGSLPVNPGNSDLRITTSRNNQKPAVITMIVQESFSLLNGQGVWLAQSALRGMKSLGKS